MINTPETDRLAEEFKRNTLPDDVKLDILFGFTRKLERECIRAEGETEKLEQERDEAISARDVALKVAHTYDEAHTKACEGWAQAERERDELFEALSKIETVFVDEKILTRIGERDGQHCSRSIGGAK
jgi:hypothetical protein